MNYYVVLPNWHKSMRPGQLHYHFTVLRDWLFECVGTQDIDWKYLTGDLHAEGIYFLREEDATAFKLRFEV